MDGASSVKVDKVEKTKPEVDEECEVGMRHK